MVVSYALQFVWLWDKLIRDYLFHRSKLESEILINFDIQHGTRKNIWTLDRGCWLDGQIITLVALQFTLKQKDRIPDAKYPAWYLPTYFSQHILQHKVHKPNMLKSYFGTKRYTGKN
ncbi:uncharacterized protein LOC114291777 [Camellia sinensis]|uniref:uncharacterized protein LOC114291777 n=1 Tax=Camellia sinensis TaxID=4442 RepID=UPI00103642F5|nr:uncharacterized protein LOC114291777 [Camellia sinensis]